MAKKKTHLKRPIVRTRKSTARRAAAAAPKQATSFPLPELKSGEGYSGILLDKAGKPIAHLIEIAIRDTEGTQKEQITWAKAQGGELPDLQESALLYANRKHAHKPRYYWTREPYAGITDYAWLQTFGDGTQDLVRRDGRYLACAVRRVPI